MDAAPTQVLADIVASVLSVEVAPGEEVGQGQTLLIIESMKMEIRVPAPCAGTVTRLAVGVGDVIQEGDVLVEIAP